MVLGRPAPAGRRQLQRAAPRALLRAIPDRSQRPQSNPPACNTPLRTARAPLAQVYYAKRQQGGGGAAAASDGPGRNSKLYFTGACAAPARALRGARRVPSPCMQPA